VRVHLSEKQVTAFFVALLLLVVSACSLAPDSSADPTQKPLPTTPVATPLGVSVPVCRMAACTNLNPVPGIRPFIDTWENIHLFQTFDFNVTYPAATAKNLDFVWGADPTHVWSYRASNPNLLLSYYITLHRDNGTFTNTDISRQRGESFWKQIHPSWILYKCDRTTPAIEYGSPSIAFALNNPEVFNWQLTTYVNVAQQWGYDAIAVDNVNMENMFGGCGYYDKNGQWVQRYTGQMNDPAWQADVLSWATQMQATLHALPRPMLLMANFSYGSIPLKSDATQKVLQHLDGVLDESSFTQYGETHIAADAWVQMVKYVSTMQRQNKPFLLVNEFKADQTISHDDMQWVIGSYLMCKQRLAMLYIAYIQSYGTDKYLTLPEYALQIGSPRGEMYEDQGVYWRDYTGGQVVVNPFNVDITVTLSPGASYVDPYGAHIDQTLRLPALSAKIMLNAH